MAGLLSAREVSLENVVCNPGAYVTVPISLNEAQGLAVVSLTLTYDPQILVLHEVRQGTLAETFSFDFTVVEDTGMVEIVSVAPTNIETSASGTLADIAFYVREKSDSLYSTLTLADVRFNEETMTRDLTIENPTVVQNGLIRSLATTNSCQMRLGEGAVVIAGETTLQALTLQEGDALQLSGTDTPITVEGTLHAPNTILLKAPKNGWTTANYPILRCKTSGLNLMAADAPAEASIVESEDGEYRLYTLTTVVEEELQIESNVELSANDQSILRELLAGSISDTTTKIVITGTQEAIEMGVDLGLVPETTIINDSVTANFTLPTLEIVDFNPQAGMVRAKIIPPEGASIGNDQHVKGVIHLYGSTSLTETMREISSPEIDLSPYLQSETSGEMIITVQFGSNTFFKVTAGRVTEEQKE